MDSRSRRDKQSKLDKLSAYKRAREGGKREWKSETADDIYDEVTEEQYKQVVKGRLLRDDFIEDDDGGGYADNGMEEDWGNRDDEEQDDEDDRRDRKGKKATTKANGKAKSKPAPPPQSAPNISAYRPTVSAEAESDFMASILDGMDAIKTAEPSRRLKRKPSPSPTRDYSRSSSPLPMLPHRAAPRYYGKKGDDDDSSDGPMPDFAFDRDTFMSPKKRARVTPATEKLGHMDVQSGSEDQTDFSFDDLDMNEFMDVDESEFSSPGDEPTKDVKPKIKRDFGAFSSKRATATNGVKKGEDTKTPAWLSMHASLNVAQEDSLGPTTSNGASVANNISPLQDDGSLHFFWLDYLEADGKVFLVGKLRDRNSGAWVSCCVTVENIERNLFILPRELMLEDGSQTDVVPTMHDVLKDFNTIRQQAGIEKWKGKEVTRNYAFGEPGVPVGVHKKWVKVVYGFNEPQLKGDMSSPNIARIFGTNTSAFELLVLKRKIMGPCWLEVKAPDIDNKGVSWCKVEAVVSDPKDINPFADSNPDAPKEIPPLTIMSLATRTIVNHQDNKREVVCATARVWNNIQLDDATPVESLPCSVHTFVRPLECFPPNFESRAKSTSKGSISAVKNERMLLNSLLMTLHKADPDVIVGHEFLGSSLDVLLHRMRELKADHWSRMGRMRRSKWPNVGRQGSNLKFLQGRLMCDLASDGAKGMIASTTWSLTEMVGTHLKSERHDIDPDDTASYFDGTVSSPDRLLTFVRHCELDAHFQMALASKVQILPLTKQLTNLAGNSWNKTLNGGRAERNEYILLHEFHRLKYICPDKLWGKKAAVAVVAAAEDADGGAKTKAKRDKYKGGLVFEPKRGLWDKFVLVMDFNSLYPSIIQEYNIDFTTVERTENDDAEDKIPEPPSSDVKQGVLPRLIASLVSRRRQVKSLMKDRKATPAQLLQWDIKQQAFKLTANSMYGCLGFEYSRFYARPLAALTTFKGREILTQTRELAESLSLDVVYGDTDSVFVNTNVTDFAEALKISADLKKHVNERYRLLEIDLDGVFQRLLLLQKKKYAAVKMEDATKTSIEVKGLDMKRREYCPLSKTVSQYLLNQILSGDATEIVVENIHEYLTSIGTNVREGKIKLDEFIINKRLGKSPEDYPDGKSQPHVQVALRMRTRGGVAKAGDVIPYIFCLGEDGQTSKTQQAERARHPDEFRKAESELQIDYEFYLANQILPTIERLCDPIEGTDRARLAECLGLDPNRYRGYDGGDNATRAFGSLDSQVPENERFKDCDRFLVNCRSCGTKNIVFNNIEDREGSIVLPSGPTCPNKSCSRPLNSASLQVQLETQIREKIGRYYQGWLVCDDAMCANRTRSSSVYGRRCLRPGCSGTMAFEYSDSAIYDQLRYYASLFDADKILQRATGSPNSGAVSAALNNNNIFLHSMADIVNKYLDECGRKWVDLGAIFGAMRLLKV